MKPFIRVLYAIVVLLIVVGTLAAVKGQQIGRMTAQSEAFVPPPQTVTAAPVARTEWADTLRAVGSLEAVQGVTVTAELPGKVTRIAFTPGARVEAGQLLVQQDISVEQAQLRAAESETSLTRRNMERFRKLADQQLAPRATYDERKAAYEKAVAQADLIRATIAKKTIQAPFDGRLGIRQVDQGEVLDSGQAIVSLQALDPIFVNFRLPQQVLAKLEPGITVEVTTEKTGEITTGHITAINPDVDPRSRNIQVQATLANPAERLRPGMFVSVTAVLPARRSVLAIPATAVQYAPYSDSVFVVEPKVDGADPEQLVLRQQFVQLGTQRGDFVAVADGLAEGQTVVTTGVFKLRNGQSVVVDNRLAPTFETDPRPPNT